MSFSPFDFSFWFFLNIDLQLTNISEQINNNEKNVLHAVSEYMFFFPLNVYFKCFFCLFVFCNISLSTTIFQTFLII